MSNVKSKHVISLVNERVDFQCAFFKKAHLESRRLMMERLFLSDVFGMSGTIIVDIYVWYKCSYLNNKIKKS